jgi:aminoglycoside 6'-N-acetyltransferase
VIEFRPITADDLRLLHTWLQREHVKRWWRDTQTYEEVVEHYLPGREEHYVIALEGRPVGMIQTYLVADYPEWQQVVEVGDGVAGLDLLIGEEELTGRGLGPRVLEAFMRDVLFMRPGTTACVATVEEANRRSWRAFEKAGFRHVRDVEEDGLPHRLMRIDRESRVA